MKKLRRPKISVGSTLIFGLFVTHLFYITLLCKKHVIKHINIFAEGKVGC